MTQTFRIGTRKSAMALAQTREVARRLQAAHGDLSVEIAEFTPRGDADQLSRLDRHGGKGGAFVAEIRAAMRAGDLACAMHSLKDMPGDEEAPGLVIAAYLTRDPPTDALVLRPGLDLAAFEADGGAGHKIGTNAVRRAAYLRRIYPKAEIIHFRGAADTRIRKLDEGAMQKLPDGGAVGPADALVMARSGLERVGLIDRMTMEFEADAMLPAIGQGIVAVECAATDWEARARLSAIDDAASRTCAEAEREALWILNGHCNAPIAGHARIMGERLTLRAAVIAEDGSSVIETSDHGPADRPRELGRKVGLDLLVRGAAELIAESRLEPLSAA